MALQGLGRVLVLNAGSSSLKFKLFDLAPALASTVGGMIDRIGDKANSALIAKKSDSNGTTKFKDQASRGSRMRDTAEAGKSLQLELQRHQQQSASSSGIQPHHATTLCC
jgi:acetate kinase